MVAEVIALATETYTQTGETKPETQRTSNESVLIGHGQMLPFERIAVDA